MANERLGSRILNFIQNNIIAVIVVWCALEILIPLPQPVVDVCMVINLALSIIILLVVVTTPRASDFETFPRLILIQNTFGLGINISSTVLILKGSVNVNGQLQNQSFMVQAFAKFIAGDDPLIGAVVFIVIILAQLLVFTKGASRVSEVAARFTLDSMSQKFFAIDNKLNSGAITQEEAEREKEAVNREIDFYSAMDGSSKFVSGNVKLGIVITLVNLIVGIIIGVWRNDMDFMTAFSTYGNLTIGDGLTSQIPSILISIATGILVTGTKSDKPLNAQLASNLTRDTHIYEILGGVFIILGVVFAIVGRGTNGALSSLILIPFGALCVFFGVRLSSKKEKKEQQKKQEEEQKTASTPQNNQESGPVMLDPLSLELGYALVPLVDAEKGAELIDRLGRIRTEARYDMGFEIPKIRIRDDITLKPDQYSFKIDGIEAGSACVKPGYLMCMDTGTVVTPLEGEKTKDPAFGMDAIWLPESQRSDAEAAGYVVVDAPTVISTHITEIIRSNAAKMIDTQAVSVILDKVKETNPVLVSEILDTAKISYRTILSVLQNLLEEKVSIRNYKKILETMANYANGRTVWQLTEKVREALGLQICMQYVDQNERKLRVMRLSQDLTEMIAQHEVAPNDGSKPYVALDPVDRRRWIRAISTSLRKVTDAGYMPVILCVSQVRSLVRNALEREQPGVVVLSDTEVMNAGSNISVEIIDEIEDEKVEAQVE